MSSDKHLSMLLDEFIKNGPSGCGCAVAKDGKMIYESYHGLADIESNRPVDEHTVYRMFSMTKVVVCTAAMMLFERGKFLLNEPLSNFFPAYKNPMVVHTATDGSQYLAPANNPMLVKHAFSMQVGLPYTFGNSATVHAMLDVKKELAEKGPYDLQTEINAMSRVPLVSEPGTHFLYGYGHELVAGLIEVVSGKSVGEFLQTELFEPLGMTSTGYRYFGDIRERMASMYQLEDDGSKTKIAGMLDEFHEPDAIYEMGGAGLFSTVRDYLTFTQMLANGGVHQGKQIIGRKTIDLMRQNQLGEQALADFQNSYLAGYGYGLGVRTMMSLAEGGANSSIGEFGWTGAAGTYTVIDPEEGFSLVYMHQLSPNLEEYHHLRVRAAAYGLLGKDGCTA